MRKTDLIVAPATPAGRGAVGIVRLSGAGVSRLAKEVLRKGISPRVATLSRFFDRDGQVIDKGLAIYFPAGRSYTGEEMLELQGHGGPVVQKQLLRRCLDLGARMATPGEFTQRAFLNDRMDLSQAEAVADLIDAQSELAARGALRAMQGELSGRVSRCVEQLVELRSLVEASMDFPEEGLDYVPDSLLHAKFDVLKTELAELRNATQQGRRLRDGATLALVGNPNVGKSSLLNRLAQHEAAIVSEIPGTTRDVIREHIVIDGLPFEVLDTAGLRASDDALENMGMKRTLQAIEEADLVLHIMDVSDESAEIEVLHGRSVLRVINKIDLVKGVAYVAEEPLGKTVYLSAKDGLGIDILRRAMVEALGWVSSEEGALIARERHLVALEEANEAVARGISNLGVRELFAEELRSAQNALSKIAGEFSSDDLLGEIFSTFCIGK